MTAARLRCRRVVDVLRLSIGLVAGEGPLHRWDGAVEDGQSQRRGRRAIARTGVSSDEPRLKSCSDRATYCKWSVLDQAPVEGDTLRHRCRRQ